MAALARRHAARGDGARRRGRARVALARLGPSLGVTLVELGVAPDGVVHAALRRIGRPPAAARARVRPIDVVVPIHDARAETIACLESVLAHATGDWRLVPVDDASTDATLVAWLDALAAREPRVQLLRNPQNRGFVGTANRGMRAAGERDVVLLNSDTIATPGFLDGLEAAAYAGDAPALVSPLSNNATILSVPEWCRPNPLPPGWELDDFAALVRRASPLLRPSLPTAHGFCMYVPAAVRDAVGLFDEEAFGRGFGEENDLCERARAAGFPSRCADDVLVWHAGHASFGAEAADELTRSHFATLHARHPEYLPRVAAFVEANPLAPVQGSIRLALRRPHADVPALLCVLHASFDHPAGGTEHHVRDLVAALRLPRVVVAAPEWDAIALTEVFDGDLDGAVHYRLPLAEPSRRFQLARADVTRAMREIVPLFGVGAAHLHQLCGWPVSVWRELHDLGVPFVATFQDFYPVCPNVNLWDAPSDRLCCLAAPGEGPDPEACLRHAFAVFGQAVEQPLAWREAHRAEFRALLAHAERVFFPAQRTHDIVARFQPADPARWVVEPHGYLEPTRRATPDPRRRPLNIALLGEIAYPIKGSRHYEPLIARTRDLPLAWHVFGEAERFGFADRLRALGLGSRLHLHGRYHRDEICERLSAADIDLVVFLPPWPETFSYTLSEALIAGVPVVVTDQGALTERVHASGAGIVVRNVDEAVVALTRLVEEDGALATIARAAQRYRHRSLPEMAAAYAPVYRDLLGRGPRPSALDADDRLRLVTLHRQPSTVPPAPAAVALPPALPHYGRAWYRLYVRVAGLVPTALRRWARERVASRWWRTVRALPFGQASAPVSPNDGLELVGRTRGRAAYRVLHDDPAFVFTAGPFRARDVRVIRFAMRCEARGDLFAQVFWSHGASEAFSEDKSLRIPIVAGDGQWHDYTVLIDESDRRAVWDAGEEIVHLRFDPLNAPGLVELGVLHLCTPAANGRNGADQGDGARP
ncbi:MAG: glycosyltransferase [bacterium]|nr:glycosyltransferase [bacterium]